MQTMDGIFTNLKRMFQSGNILSKLIYINVGLFILIRLASVLFMLFNVQGVPFLQYLQLPASPELLLFRPWTLFTYMFTHFDFLHILFNMLWLYWFGGLFLNFFNERQLGYLIYIHYRLHHRLRYSAALGLLVFSFLLLQVCWVGVNYLPSAQGYSVHTYNME